MNIYKFELRAIWKSLVMWVLIMIVSFYFLVAGLYPMFAEGTNLLGELLEYMPSEYLLVLGLDIDNMFGYSGFYSFAYIYIGLIATLMATSISLAVFGREKKSHCQEFIFAKPVSRRTLFCAKMLAVVTALALFNVVAIAISLICFGQYGTLDSTALLASLSIPFNQLVYVGIATLLALRLPKLRATTPICAIVGLLTFFITVEANALQLEWLYYLSPLHYFSPNEVFQSGGYNGTLVIVAVVILLITVGLSVTQFLKADVKDM